MLLQLPHLNSLIKQNLKIGWLEAEIDNFRARGYVELLISVLQHPRLSSPPTPTSHFSNGYKNLILSIQKDKKTWIQLIYRLSHKRLSKPFFVKVSLMRCRKLFRNRTDLFQQATSLRTNYLARIFILDITFTETLSLKGVTIEQSSF